MAPSPVTAQRQSTIVSKGFTLIELLVVITIIVVLLALLTPALDKAMTEAQMAQCLSNPRTIAQGAIAYTADNKGLYPDRPQLRSGAWKRFNCIYDGRTNQAVDD